MSDNLTSNEQQGPHPTPQIPCPKCSRPIEVKLGRPECNIHGSVFIIVIQHSGEIECPSCGLKVFPAIQSITGMSVGLTVSQTQDKSKVGLFPERALRNLPLLKKPQ
jgi:DNA-directed RNA polymerase subunit RPC12/RpoP